MAKLESKIDFVALVSVTRANGNGDPLDGNRPRTDYNGFGEISDVCIKRKIRNRMQDLGNEIFVQSDDKYYNSRISEFQWVSGRPVRNPEKTSILCLHSLFILCPSKAWL